MKNLFVILFLSVFSFTSLFAQNIEDTSIIDELGKQEIKSLDFDFKLRSFESCENLEDVMWKYIKDYWKNNKDKWAYPIMYRSTVLSEGAIMDKSISANTSLSSDSNGWNNFSETNIQIEWVDESDIVKTDWKYIYYYNESDKYVYIVEKWDLKIIKKIKLPKNFNRPVLYIWTNRLTIISSWYNNVNYSKMGYWVNRNAKTYTIVFDTTNIKKPVLSKLYVADWELKKSRKIGDYIYVISNNNFQIPYRSFKNIDDIEIDIAKILPKKIDISKTSDKNKQNLKLRGLDLPYNITAWNVAKCNEIEYALPDIETMNEFNFDPSYNTISIIDTKNTENKVKTTVIAGSNAELFMSLDNMYLTSNIYKNYDFKCSWGLNCIMPFYSRWNNTIIHKLSIDKNNIWYQWSAMIPWTPLTQYSMDEYKWDFRILTSINTWWQERKQETNLYILDKNLDLKWSLTWLWWWENFKSSRYIWDKLYLVTFKQIDPLFVIDVSDSSNPKVLWELQIPGYSTYLHPYDENYLIGLWYDTKENKWGWTVNNGLKVDLYDVSDFKNPKQKFSYTFWWNWSYSEALNNPRMFMWDKNRNKLFLPATIYKNDESDMYKKIDFFQGLVAITIDKDSGIKEDFRLTHINYDWIDKKRKKECSKYIVQPKEEKCVKLINGSTYCEPTRRQYIPKYCYADSTVWEYMVSRSWNYKDSFIKRAVWIDNNIYSISDDSIRSFNIDTGIKTASVEIGE